VARLLAAAGVSQRLLVRDPSRAPALPAADVVVAGSYGDANAMAKRLRCALRMEQVTVAVARQREISPSMDGAVSLARCRELLGDEAAVVSAEELECVRDHAAAMAHVLVLEFLENIAPVG